MASVERNSWTAGGVVAKMSRPRMSNGECPSFDDATYERLAAESLRRRRESTECSSDGSGCLWAGVGALVRGVCGGSDAPDFSGSSSRHKLMDGQQTIPFGVDSDEALKKSPAEEEEDEEDVQPSATPRRRIMSPLYRAEVASTQSLASMTSSDATDFEESEASERRADSQERRVLFGLDRNVEYYIASLTDMSWRTRRDCYWQPEEYAAMSQSRLWLERAVLQTGGRVKIEGESRRGLGLVCEPETRIARASKIQQTQRAILRMHAEGASSSRLAKFAADASCWATRNALICARKDVVAAAYDPEEEEEDDDNDILLTQRPSQKSTSTGYSQEASSPVGLETATMTRCDSNTAENNGLASLIRNDSLGNLKSKESLAAYARARRRISPATFESSNSTAVHA